MRMLFKKMLRDLRDYKIQFLSIFLMAFLGVFIFTGITGEAVGIIQASTQYYKNTNLADIWIYSDNFSNETLNKIMDMKEVKDANREMIIPTIANYSSDPDITLHILEKNNSISKFHVFEGKGFNIDDKYGIWIDKRFADNRKLNVGDNLTLKVNGITLTKKIRGLIFSPEYVYYIQEGSLVPDFAQVGYAYISKEAIEFPIIYNTITIDTYDDISTFSQNKLDNTIGSDTYNQFLLRENNIGVKQLQEEINQHQMFSRVFPIIFVLVALLTLLTTMSRVIASQRTQIGTLKAMGYNNKSIILHYLSFGFFLSFLGSILGLIIGPLTLPRLFYPSMSSMFSLPIWEPTWDISFFIVATLVIISSVLVTYISVKSINNENPADSIKPKIPTVVTSSIIEKTPFWKNLGFNSRWNYRDAKRNKIRAIMSIFGVFSCTVLVMSAFGINDSMNDVTDWQYNDIYKYNTKINLEKNITNYQLSNILNETNGETIMEDTLEIEYNGKKKMGFLTVLNDSKLYKTTNIDRKYIKINPKGVAISTKMAELLDVKIGDTIKWHISGNQNWVESKITEFYSVPFGQGLIMSPETLEDLGYNYTETSILTEKNVNNNFTGVNSLTTRETMIKGWYTMIEAMNLLISILIIFAVILAVVVLYNLGLLSFTEIQIELATLKVLGFNSTKLRRLLLTQNLWFSTIGFLLAIPGSYFLMNFMMQTSGESYYFPINIYLGNLIISFLITYGLSVIVNLLFSGKIKKINMVESLKSND